MEWTREEQNSPQVRKRETGADTGKTRVTSHPPSREREKRLYIHIIILMKLLSCNISFIKAIYTLLINYVLILKCIKFSRKPSSRRVFEVAPLKILDPPLGKITRGAGRRY